MRIRRLAIGLPALLLFFANAGIATAQQSEQQSAQQQLQAAKQSLEQARRMLAQLEQDQARESKERHDKDDGSRRTHAVVVSQDDAQGKNAESDDKGNVFKFYHGPGEATYQWREEKSEDGKTVHKPVLIRLHNADQNSSRQAEQRIVIEKQGDDQRHDEHHASGGEISESVMELLRKHGIDPESDDVDVNVHQSEEGLRITVEKSDGKEHAAPRQQHKVETHKEHAEYESRRNMEKNRVIVRERDRSTGNASSKDVFIIEREGHRRLVSPEDNHRNQEMYFPHRNEELHRQEDDSRPRERKLDVIVDRPVEMRFGARVEDAGRDVHRPHARSVHVVRPEPARADAMVRQLENRIGELEESVSELHRKIDRLLDRTRRQP